MRRLENQKVRSTEVKKVVDEVDLIEVLKRIFKAIPEKSAIELKDKCSECGDDVIIAIAPTSGGFGIKGGFLLRNNSVSYFVKCLDCYDANSKSDLKLRDQDKGERCCSEVRSQGPGVRIQD